MNIIKKRTLTTSSLLLLAVIFIALIILSNTLLRSLRIDLTESGLYTLSEGTENMLASINEPINLYFFFSDRASKDIPLLRTYANRVRELLEEFAAHADGKLKLQVIDPLPFSEQEDRAAQFGLQAIPLGTASENVYFGLAGTNTVDGVEVIGFFQPDKEAFLEYDLAKLIHSLAYPKKPVIGLYSSLPLNGGFDPMSRRPSQPWIVAEQMRQLFEVRTLGGDLTAIDDDIDVLMLVHPKDLSENTLYAIDQYVLNGGKAMVFVDPHAEAEPVAGPNPAAAFASRASSLPRLLKAWGVEVDDATVLGDSRYALAVNVSRGEPPVRHLGILSFDQTALAQDDVATAQLDTVNVSFAGYVQPLEGVNGAMLPLITSSVQAMPIGAEQVRMLPDPAILQKGFKPTGEQYVVAARLQGKAKSAFPDGPPKGDEPEASSEEASTEESSSEQASSEDPSADHIAESSGPINVIVVADTDLLSDRLWVQSQDFFGQRIATAWANNGDFVVNALDNLTGDSDLISIRGRATATRPFTTVEALEREADGRFRATELALQEQLQETERKLNELQSNRDDASSLILTDEQRVELERFQQEKLEIRKQLRQVRRELDKNIEQLGTWLKLVNIGLVPLLLSVAAVVAAWLRMRHRKAALREVRS